MAGYDAEEEPPPLPELKDHPSAVLKGKRTKRQRTPSPSGAGAMAAASSSSASGGGDYDFSPSSSGMTVLGSTEEEEDLAYCLILLAQGPRRRRDEEIGSSKRFSEVAAGAGDVARAGFYVYECKTCNRAFPSFQALGGHRASHKKPKAAAPAAAAAGEEEDEAEEGQYRNISMSYPPLFSPNPNFQSKLLQAAKPKIHECSICGSEFSSGQALGGHMRRHRAATAAAAPSPSLSGRVTMSVDSVGENEPRSGATILSLDLNLPAPEDDRKFQFPAAAAPKPPLLFSAPALVDCHY